jgi:dUTP pyrophosphatase
MLRTIQFQGHWGEHDPLTNKCIFYNVTFENICVASKYLKKIPAGPSYVGVLQDNVLFFEIKQYTLDNFKTMEVHRHNGHAFLPRRASDGAAGYDLFSSENVQVPPRGRRLVSTGISIKIPPGLYGRIAPRSGIAVKNGIDVGAGVVDMDYRGEVKVLLFNMSDEAFEVCIGERIAQLILERHETPAIVEVSELSGGKTERGENGFGSTG